MGQAGRNPPSVLGGIRLRAHPDLGRGPHRSLFGPKPRDGRFILSLGVIGGLAPLPLPGGFTASYPSAEGGFVSVPEPGVSPCVSRRRGPRFSVEFPQA